MRKEEDEGEQEAHDFPSKLFPDVPATPIPSRLPLRDYTGAYHHPGYGFMNVTLEAPSSAVVLKPPFKGAAESSLYSKSRHENILYTFDHVSGEYWLVGERSHIHKNEIADDYTKARFEIGPNGVVEKLGIVMEESVKGDAGWAWYQRCKQDAR